jgi:outer membrane protein TolC
MFPWFGTLARRKAAEAQAAAAAYQDVEQERNKLIWQIQRHWYELYRLRRAQHFAQQQREWLSQLAQLATQRISSGSGTASEVVRIQMRTAERREEAAALGDRFAAERDRLARTLNRDSLPPLALPDSLRLPPPDTSGPLEQHPALQQLQHQQRTLALRKQVVQKERMPSLGVGVDYINLGSREQAVPGNGRDALAAGVRVSVPLWQQRYTARLDELTQQQQATADEAQSVRNQLASQAAEARATRREHRRKLQHYREQLQRGRRSLRLLRSEYSAGTAELDALLAMEAQLLSYQRQLHRSLAAARRAQARLHYLSAQPLNAYKDVIQTTEE